MEEHEKILQMLEEGKLRAEEASRLFEALKLKLEKRKVRHLNKHMKHMLHKKRHGFGFDRCFGEDDCEESLLDSGITDCIGPVRINMSKSPSGKKEGSEENARILKMLKEGKITAEEASQLIKAVRKSYASDDCTIEIEKGFHHEPRFGGTRFGGTRFGEHHHFSHHHFGPGPKRVVVKLRPGDMHFDCCD